jgi:phenylalanyl-tRNA synthetase beta chain
MLISRNWLQSHFETELPDAQTIAETLLLHSFEVEGVTKIGDDDVIDIDVLPNRAHDCLCHAGVARELACLLDIPLRVSKGNFSEFFGDADLSITITSDQCTRYIGTRVDNVKIAESPKWLKERLASMGQKSINNLVDITNYVMFDLGQPMHVFDADKVSGGITIRNAKQGEVMTILGGDEIELQENDLLICDDEGILALAGVKGGTKAEVDENTQNIIIEAAHFHPTSTRLTARRIKILTDASKRYENEISAEKAALANDLMIKMMQEIMDDGMEFRNPVDMYPNPESEYRLVFTGSHTRRLLGFDIGHDDIKDILNRLDYAFTQSDDEYTVDIPADRIDLRIAEDMIEEIGRIYGYHKIPAQSVDEFSFDARVHVPTLTAHKLRNILVRKGFFELMTYSFVNKGEIEVRNPIARDKKALRKTIWKQLESAVERNAKNADYFGLSQIKVFEIGRVYTIEKENLHCVIHIHNVNKKARKTFGNERDQLESLLNDIETAGIQIESTLEGNNLVLKLDTASVSENEYDDVFALGSYPEDAQFHTISPYQFMTRDISLWLPKEMSISDVYDLIQSAGMKYLKKTYLFDEFEKDGRTSVAYSLVFQSDTGTLADEDLEPEMKKLETLLQEKGAEIR